MIGFRLYFADRDVLFVPRDILIFAGQGCYTGTLRGISILENAFRIAGQEERPRYLQDDERRPSVWESERSIVVINWGDESRTVTVPGVFPALISQKPFTLDGTTLTVTLAPHESFSAVYGEA